MKIINARNVNDAYRQGRALLSEIGVRQSSRAGDVLVAPCPVTTVYERPCERVLLDAKRDANPLFHICEAIWMLAGQSDARWLDRYVHDFSARFAEASGHMHGAYGNRWRGHFMTNEHFFGDQLGVIVERLRRDPDDRRVVISMWDAETDLFEADLGVVEPKDLPCNLVVAPRIRREVGPAPGTMQSNGDYIEIEKQYLDITVFCRSNDIVFGAYGANAVHFSVLQEYLASAIGVQVGRLYQISNNWHGYVDVLKKTEPEYDEDWLNPYSEGLAQPVRVHPLVNVPEAFLRDCEYFVEHRNAGDHAAYANRWFCETLLPMQAAHDAYRQKDMSCALAWAEQVAAPDWRAACLAWIQRRMK